ncbi:hypothetical protein LINPERHAP1_LOCUS37679 [Linum perenne]
MMSTRKFESGCSKRKKKQKIEELVQSKKGAIRKFFVRATDSENGDASVDYVSNANVAHVENLDGIDANVAYVENLDGIDANVAYVETIDVSVVHVDNLDANVAHVENLDVNVGHVDNSDASVVHVEHFDVNVVI